MAEPLPRGYAERETGELHVVARTDALELVLEAVRASGSLYGWALEHAAARLPGGRADVAVLEPNAAERWAVRHCWRGGAVARFLGDRYLRVGARRPVHELRVSAVLRDRGVNTPQVVAAVVQESGLWYRGDVATAMIAGATDLAELTLGHERWPEPERERAWFAAGTLLHRFFLTGALHADLNLRNIIVQREGMRAYLLDLDRCEVGEPMRKGAVNAMLARFHRSRRKLERALGAQVGTRELAALQRGCGA